MNASLNPVGPAEPLVSIVTVCFNAETHLREAIECVLEQSHPCIEYVVVDGGSTDGTLAILKEFEPRFGGRMHWISEPDNGLYDAMNKGVLRATGTLIGLLNADDLYPPDAVRQAVETWMSHPHAGVIYGDTCNIDSEGSRTLERPAPPVVTLDTMMEGMIVCHQSMFVTAETYAAVGAYDTQYRILADYDFTMRCVQAGVEFANTGTNLSLFRLGGASGQFIRALDRELTQIRIKNGASPLSQWALYCRHAASSFVYELFKGNDAFVRFYQRYKGR